MREEQGGRDMHITQRTPGQGDVAALCGEDITRRCGDRHGDSAGCRSRDRVHGTVPALDQDRHQHRTATDADQCRQDADRQCDDAEQDVRRARAGTFR